MNVADLAGERLWHVWKSERQEFEYRVLFAFCYRHGTPLACSLFLSVPHLWEVQGKWRAL